MAYNIKIEDVVPFGDVLRALFKAHFDGVVAYDDDYADPWLATVFDVQKGDVNDMVTTPGMKKLKKGGTKERNDDMDKMKKPYNNKLSYTIGKCLTAGTITDSRESFGVAALNKSITARNIGAFHTNYEVTLARINATGNAAALNTKGFTTAMLTEWSALHDSAWGINTANIDLSQDISTLSDADLAKVNTFLGTCMLLISAIRSYAVSTGDEILAKRATFEGIKKSVEPGKAKEPRDLVIEPFESRVVATDLAAKHRLQMTLITKGVIVVVCRQTLKTGTCTTGTTLVVDEMLDVVKADIPGSGERIVITNKSGKRAVVRFLKIEVA